MPKRITSARWLWTIRNQPDKAKLVARITTPAGWLAYQLTGQFNLGIGDAAGMFPIDQSTLDYDQRLLKSFDELVHNANLKPLRIVARRAAGRRRCRFPDRSRRSDHRSGEGNSRCASRRGPACLIGRIIDWSGRAGVGQFRHVGLRRIRSAIDRSRASVGRSIISVLPMASRSIWFGCEMARLT